MDEKFMVFNTNGVIIAATEQDRVGVFHEASYNMICNNMDMITVTPDEVRNYLGVKPGIDMLIRHNGEIMGGIGITGGIKESMPLITLARLTIESMLDYEIYKEKANLKHSQFEELCEMLINYEKQDESKLIMKAKQLNYLTHIPRIAILFIVPDGFGDPNEVFEIIQNYEKLESQDILFMQKRREIVLFKTLPFVKRDIFSGYQDYLDELLTPLQNIFLRRQLPVFRYIGSMQTHLEYYKFAYRHCLWMKDMGYNQRLFYDYMISYVMDLVPPTEINGIYDSISGLLEGDMKQNFVEIFSALGRTNYNMVAASRELHIHKNTLIFHLDKYRELYNMNPMQSSRDRSFCDLFVTFLKQYKKST